MSESEPEFDVALPGEWMIIPLLRATAAHAAVARIVAQGVGRRDEDARLRAELRASFTTAVDQARGAGATQLHLCRELVAGVPLPASLTVYWPRLSLAATRESDPLAALRKLLGPPPTAESGSGLSPAAVADPALGATEPREERVSDVDLTEFAAGPTVRRTRLVTGRPTAPHAGRPAAPATAPSAPTAAATRPAEPPEVTTVEVDYWIAAPHSRLLLLSFACGMPLLRDQLVELFDLIVSTLRWR